MFISPLQKYEPKDFTGLVTENHLGAMYQQEPILVSNLIEHIYRVNIGEDIVSFMDKFPTLYINDDVPYEWLLQGSDEKNIPLIAAYDSDGSTAITSVAQPCIAGSRIKLLFGERLFEATDVIVGHKPEFYKYRIVEDTIQVGANYLYTVELVTGDNTLFVPQAELVGGTRWSKDYSLVEQTLSKRGGSTYHTSPFRMQNVLSMIRKQYTVPGNMIRKGQNNPLAFAWKDQSGKTQQAWIKKLDWDFMTQFRREKARLLAWGTSNKTATGAYGNKGDSGFDIRSGAGLYEQIAPSNVFYYNAFNINWMVELALGLSVGKLPEDQRHFILSTGEYGMYQFHKAVTQDAALFTPNFNTDRIKMTGNNAMSYRGQFMEYVSVNGIKFGLMHDPLKDDPIRNKIMHPDGGLASSYEYTIMDFGTANGEPNIQKVGLKGDEEIFRFIPGLRDPFSPYNNTTQPGMAATSVDGYEVHKAYIGGVRVKNPMRMARIIPAILA